MMRARLSFWLCALDLAHAIRAPRSVYLWLVGCASNATDWGQPIDPQQDGRPW